MKKDLSSMTKEEMLSFVTEELCEKSFRAGQIFAWINQRHARSLSEMTDLSKELRKRLEDNCDYEERLPKIKKTLISKFDGTRKYLIEMHDGEKIEAVLMRYKKSLSVCLSTEAGCPMGCSFCASALNGKVRNLTTGEIAWQLYLIEDDIKERIDHAVLMGTGEPLDNYENVISFIRLITDEKGQNLSGRNLTLSTCGIVPGIKRLADEELQLTLALSLHSAIQEEREKIMPVAKSYKLPEVIDACRYYFKKTGRRVTIEYSLIKGVNDRDEDAEALLSLLKGFPCHINLIPVNPVEERIFKAPDRSEVLLFQNKLEKYGINVTIRRELGRDIKGSCGQLRNAPAD